MSRELHDDALETLFLPFQKGGLVSWPTDGALFLRAREGRPLHELALTGLCCEQSFKPEADALRQAGRVLGASDEPGAPMRYPLVLMLPPRQRDEARALMARALTRTAPGGRVIASMTNNEGARSSESDLEKLVGPVESLSKNKCRVFWSAPLQGPIDEGLFKQWLTLDAIRPIESGRFVSRPGVFAWDRIDVASALLAEQFPQTLEGRAADLGAGFGFLSAELLTRAPGITALDVYEAEDRALALARRNLSSFETRLPIEYHWHDVTAGLPRTYDVIVCNPPFHTHSRPDRPDIGRAFIAVAARSLKPGGRLWLVANRHLPYEAVLNDGFGTVRTVTRQHGFKIIEAVKSAATSKPERKPPRRRP